MKLSRLRGRKINERLRNKKITKLWRGNTMTIRWISGPPKSPNIDPAKRALYVGTAASLKLHKSAVKRNRMRRRCREAFRKTVREIEKLPTTQLLITPRSASLSCDFEDILEDVSRFLEVLR